MRKREINRLVTADRQKRLSVMSKCGAGDDDDDDDDIGRMPVQIEGSGEREHEGGRELRWQHHRSIVSTA